MFLKKEQSQNEPYQTNQPELQQDFFRPVSEFSTKKFPNYDLSEFCYKRDRKFKKCLFSSQFHSFGVELYHNSKVLYRFYAKYAKIIWKCPHFLSEISSILDTRIRPGKRYESSSCRKFRALQCPRDKG